MGNTFAITGMGRSGTAWLASMLNRSPTWTVRHEPHGGFAPVSQVRDRFARHDNCYGEVNSYLRFQLLALDVRWRAVIVRDPLQIFQSMFNRGKPRLDHLHESLLAIDGLIQRHVDVISFSRLTGGDLATLNTVALRCGIEDLPEADELLEGHARNQSQPRAMPAELRRRAERQLGWFAREYSRLY